ncbi:putative loganate O-methyltransferase [Rosa chinensis]|uniref:Putative loganate O-methyltransferase n=1 Tax=Rosa chinensis TaxID=74649 RepID=A0A2P6P1Y7_ROSCH|nr:putative loganate O-methyltransferase [Rosa chinensis]
MAAEDTSKVCEAHPMTGGDGPNSYAKNSTFQRGGVDAAKELLSNAIAEKLDIQIFPSNTFVWWIWVALLDQIHFGQLKTFLKLWKPSSKVKG